MNDSEDLGRAYQSQVKRLESFRLGRPIGSLAKRKTKWPKSNKPSAESMSEAGFFFDPLPESKDNAACFNCGVAVDGWAADDIPIREHLRISPQCLWANLLGCRVRGTDYDCEPDLIQGTYACLLDAPRSARSNEVRAQSFHGWPLTPQKPSIESLAAAGFFYNCQDLGDDTCTCVYCGYSLEGWEPEDDPDKEHIRRTKDCYIYTQNMPLLRQTKKESEGHEQGSDEDEPEEIVTVSKTSQRLPLLDDDSCMDVDQSKCGNSPADADSVQDVGLPVNPQCEESPHRPCDLEKSVSHTQNQTRSYIIISDNDQDPSYRQDSSQNDISDSEHVSSKQHSEVIKAAYRVDKEKLDSPVITRPSHQHPHLSNSLSSLTPLTLFDARMQGGSVAPSATPARPLQELTSFVNISSNSHRLSISAVRKNSRPGSNTQELSEEGREEDFKNVTEINNLVSDEHSVLIDHSVDCENESVTVESSHSPFNANISIDQDLAVIRQSSPVSPRNPEFTVVHKISTENDESSENKEEPLLGADRSKTMEQPQNDNSENSHLDDRSENIQVGNVKVSGDPSPIENVKSPTRSQNSWDEVQISMEQILSPRAPRPLNDRQSPKSPTSGSGTLSHNTTHEPRLELTASSLAPPVDTNEHELVVSDLMKQKLQLQREIEELQKQKVEYERLNSQSQPPAELTDVISVAREKLDITSVESVAQGPGSEPYKSVAQSDAPLEHVVASCSPSPGSPSIFPETIATNLESNQEEHVWPSVVPLSPSSEQISRSTTGRPSLLEAKETELEAHDPSNLPPEVQVIFSILNEVKDSPIRSIADIPESQLDMTVEQWVKMQSQAVYDRLVANCERMLSVLEEKGKRAVIALETGRKSTSESVH